MTSNTQTGVPVLMHEEFAAYDALPPFFRRVFQDATLDFAVVLSLRNYRDLRARLDERQAKRQWLRAFRDVEDRETVAAYGPDHPEARRGLPCARAADRQVQP